MVAERARRLGARPAGKPIEARLPQLVAIAVVVIVVVLQAVVVIVVVVVPTAVVVASVVVVVAPVAVAVVPAALRTRQLRLQALDLGGFPAAALLALRRSNAERLDPNAGALLVLAYLHKSLARADKLIAKRSPASAQR